MRGKKISLILQDPLSSFDPNKKCGKQLTEIIRTAKNASTKAVTEEALALVKKMKLGPRAMNLYPHQLSGGELQRFSIAVALSSNPELMAKAIVEAVHHYDDAGLLARVSKNLGAAMKGQDAATIPESEALQTRGW